MLENWVNSSEYKPIISYLRNNLTSTRFEHIMRVSWLALEMANRYDVDEKQVLLSSLGHDIARELPLEVLKVIARIDGMENTLWEEENTILLHCRVGAILIKEIFQVHDDIVLNAIRSHTLGDQNMSNVALILFCADYLESGRPYISEETRKSLQMKPLKEVVISVLKIMFEYLKSIDKKLYPPQENMAKEFGLL